MDKSIDDQLLREAREDGASRERLRIKALLQAEFRYWREVERNAPDLVNTTSGAMASLANVLCCIDGLLPPRDTKDGTGT